MQHGEKRIFARAVFSFPAKKTSFFTFFAKRSGKCLFCDGGFFGTFTEKRVILIIEKARKEKSERIKNIENERTDKSCHFSSAREQAINK